LKTPLKIKNLIRAKAYSILTTITNNKLLKKGVMFLVNFKI